MVLGFSSKSDPAGASFGPGFQFQERSERVSATHEVGRGRLDRSDEVVNRELNRRRELESLVIRAPRAGET